MNDNKGLDQIIYCSRCGSEMKKTARYCMKCGNLNFMHPANESMKQYTDQNYQNGKFIADVSTNNSQSVNESNFIVDSPSTQKTFKVCLIVNLVLHFLLPVLMTILLIAFGKFSFSIIFSFVLFGLLFLYNYGAQRMYIKAGKTWWSYIVPFYGQYVLYEISMGSGWMFLLSFIPVVGIVVGFMANYKLGKKFYQNPVLTMLFPFVMIPIIGFSKKSEMSSFV